MTEKNTSMFKRMFNRMKSQFMPTKSAQLFMTWDGTVVLKKLIGDETMFIGVNANNEVVSYDPEFVLDFPVYLIDRQYSQVSIGDIVLTNEGQNSAMYGKVTNITKNYIDVLCFNGNNLRMNKTRNVLTNTETICTVMNWLNFNGKNNGDGMFGNMNPLMVMALLSNDGSNGSNESNMMNKIMPFMMMQNTSNGKIDPTMMALMFMSNNKGDDKSNMMETFMMMQMLQNGGFSNMFGPCVGTPITEVPTKKPSAKTSKKTNEKTEKTNNDETVTE